MKFSDEQVYSYNEPSVEHFRRWLKKKYRTLERLNRAWSRKYGSWDEIQAPRRLAGGTATDFLDWTLHNTAALNERVQWRIDVMRDEDPDIRIKLHTRAYGGMQGNAATWGMDDWALAQLPDIWGGSSFYRQWPDEGYFLNNDSLWSTAKGKEFWLSEVQGGPPNGGLGRSGSLDTAAGEYTPRHMEMWTLMPFAQGAKGFMYWQWRMERKGPEWGFGVTNIDGSWSARCEAARELGRFFHKNKDLLLEAEPAPYRVALGFNPHTNMLDFLHRKHVTCCTEALMGAYKCTLYLDLPTYIVRLDETAVDDDYSPFDVITLAGTTWISPKSVRKLKAFVRAGGTLIADAGLGEFTAEKCWWSKVVPGEGLHEVFGVRRIDARTHERRGRTYADTARPVVHTINGREFASCWLEETLEPCGAEVIGEWPDGRAAVTVNRYGKGKAVYIGSSAFLAYSNNGDDALLRLYRELCAGVERPAWTDRNKTHVRVLKRRRQRVYFLFNYDTRAVTTRLTIAGGRGRLWDLRAETDVPTERCEEGSQLRLRMEPYETRIFVSGM